ncbi:hypothetical protein [Sphingomonas abietis]|uniref:Secreted protein n=1 Tax=Sphingomonas abietis TaxID=3012344 RepID=A0ABY7NW59_9SPHN|nr:hypothetical protein [Sphingomonas abietis]WBO24149.1 hypothetical protein PBT88_08600 [Sphingomonas abietis]
MPSVALLLLQAAATIAPAPPPEPDDRLLHPAPPPPHCATSTNEIVVCAKDQNSYRLQQSGPQFDSSGALPKAEWKIFGDVKAGVGTSQRNVGGYPSNAVMAKIKIPF